MQCRREGDRGRGRRTDLGEEDLVGTGDEAREDLDGEPGVADALDVEEGVVGVGLRLVQRPRRRVVRRLHRHVADHRHAHVRVRLQAERQDRDADEEHRDQAHDLHHNNNNNSNSHGQHCCSPFINIQWPLPHHSFG